MSNFVIQVSGKMTWVTVNPGSQARIGSFHPITEGDWTEAAYINTKAEKLFVAINGQDVKTVKACLQEGVDVDGKSPVVSPSNMIGRDSAGRTPLQLAAYTNSVEAAKILIENGARISTKTYDGNYPIITRITPIFRTYCITYCCCIRTL